MKKHMYDYLLGNNSDLNSEKLYKLDKAFEVMFDQEVIKEFKKKYSNKFTREERSFILFKTLLDLAKIDIYELNVRDLLIINRIYSVKNNSLHYLWKEYSEYGFIDGYYNLRIIISKYYRLKTFEELKKYINKNLSYLNNSMINFLIEISDMMSSKIYINPKFKGYTLSTSFDTVISRSMKLRNIESKIAEIENSIKKIFKTLIKLDSKLNFSEQRSISYDVYCNHNSYILHKIAEKWGPREVKKFKKKFAFSVKLRNIFYKEDKNQIIIFQNYKEVMIIPPSLKSPRFVLLSEFSVKKLHKQTSKTLKI